MQNLGWAKFLKKPYDRGKRCPKPNDWVSQNMLPTMFQRGFKVLNIMIANISCERSMPMIFTTIWRPSHSWKALKTCSQAYACDPYDLYGDSKPKGNPLVEIEQSPFKQCQASQCVDDFRKSLLPCICHIKN